jgi:hypothetical protein
MSEKEAYLEALKKADESGNVEDAKKIAKLYAEKFGDDSQSEDSDSGALKAFATGAAQGVTFGLSDEIAATGETAVDTVKTAVAEVKSKGLQGIPDTLATIGDTYSDNVKKYRESFESLEDKHGFAYGSGDIVGSIASAFATGGSGALFGAGLKAGAKTLGMNALQGAAHGYGRGKGESIDEHLKSAGLGAAVGAGGSLVGEGLGKGIVKGTKWAGEKLGAESFLNYLGAHISPVRRKVLKSLKLHKRDVVDWSKRMTDYRTINEEGVEEYLINGSRSPEDLLDLFKYEQHKTNAVIESVIGPLKKLEPADGKILYKRLKDKVIMPKAKLAQSKKAKETIDNMDKWLLEEFFDEVPDKQGQLINVPKVRGIKELQDLKRNIYEEEDGIEVLSKMKREVAKNLNDYVKDSVKNSDELAPEAKNLFLEHWQKSGDLAEASKAVLAKEAHGDGNSLVNFFHSFLNRTSIAAGAATVITGSPAMAPIVALATQKLATHPRVAAPVTKGLFKISESFKRNPKKWEGAAMQLANASAISSEAFEEALINIAADVDLSDQPLARTTEEVIRRKSAILTRLDKVDPDVADSLRNAIESNDKSSIAGIMATLAEQSKSGIIQEGIGWDGHAVTEAEVQKVSSWISSIRDVRKRSNLSKQFGADRKLPEEMLQGSSGQTSPSQFIYQKAKDKVRNPEY